MNNVILASILVVFVFEGTFFLLLGLLYKSIEKKALRIFNTFIFETTPRFKEKNSFVNYLFLFSILIWFFPFVFYAANYLSAYTVSMMVIALLAGFCLATLPFISLNRLREHFYLDLGAIVSLFALSIIQAFYFFRQYRLYSNTYGLVGMIISAFLAVLLLVPVCYTKLFDLRNNKNDDGTYSRKSFIMLAFTEWMLYPISLLSLFPLFLVTMA